MRLLLGLALCALLSLGNQASQGSTLTQDVLTAQIGKGSLVDRAKSISLALRIKPDDRSPALQRAVAEELIRTNSQLIDLRRGNAPAAALSDLEGYQAVVIDAVTDSTDEKALPALIGAFGRGWIAIRGVAKFGEPAVRPTIGAALTESTDVASDALRTLRLIIESANHSPISNRAMAEIVAVARQRLTGAQHVVIAMSACDLAIATKDPALRRRVEEIARDPQASASMFPAAFLATLRRRAQQALER